MPCPKAGRFTAAPRTPVVSFWRSAACGGRAGLGVGKKIGRGNGRSTFSWLHLFARHRFPCAKTRFWHGKSGLECSFHHPRESLSQTFHVFSPRYFNNLLPGSTSSSPSVPYSGTGPRKRNFGGMSLVFLPLSATGSCVDGWERCYVSWFRRLNHQAEHSHRRPTRSPPAEGT